MRAEHRPWRGLLSGGRGHGQGGGLIPENLHPSGMELGLKSEGLKRETFKPSESWGKR